MLREAREEAKQEGWAVIAETATPGFLGRIGDAMRRILEELGDGPPSRKLTGISIAAFGLTAQLPPERQVDWRILGGELLDILKRHETGLVITLDEIHAADRSELSQLAAMIQHFIQDQLPIGLVFAGLPAVVSDLLNGGAATFLRRADKHDLHAAGVDEVERSFSQIFRETGIAIEPEMVRRAAEATEGYPFLIQLIGYHLYQSAEAHGHEMNEPIVMQAIEAAFRRNDRAVIESALATASDRDLDFLYAMSLDSEVSEIKDVAERTGIGASMASNYRRRLLDQGLIAPADRGKVDFAIPRLREYLRRNPND